MNYVKNTGKRPCYYSTSHEKDWVPLDPHEVDMHDARSLDLSLDREGFRLTNHPSKVIDFMDDKQIDAIYNREVVDIVMELTGADEVRLTGRTLHRFSERSNLAGASDNSFPARFAHIDVSATEAEKMIKRSLPADRQPRRAAYFNAWRSIAGGTQDVPLAFCDSRTVKRQDCIEADAHFEQEDGSGWVMEAWAIAHNPDHRWYYFPDMTREEIVLFKTFDSDEAQARFVAHGAFENPICSSDAPPRHSLETRILAVWN